MVRHLNGNMRRVAKRKYAVRVRLPVIGHSAPLEPPFRLTCGQTGSSDIAVT